MVQAEGTEHRGGHGEKAGGDRVGPGEELLIQGREWPEQSLRVGAGLGPWGEGEFLPAGVWAWQAPGGGVGARVWLPDQVFLNPREFARRQEFTH